MRDLFAYRGWPWWFGIAGLVLGLMALALRARLLMIAGLLLFGLSTVGYAIHRVRTGTVEAQFATYLRFRSPSNFWSFVVFYLAFGSMFVLACIVALRRALAA